MGQNERSCSSKPPYHVNQDGATLAESGGRGYLSITHGEILVCVG
jgi:hypothetical protein